MIWLRILYTDDEFTCWPVSPKKIDVTLEKSIQAPIPADARSFRISPIFPLVDGQDIPSIGQSIITFYSFQNAYAVLGKIEKSAPPLIKDSTYFSIGLASIILIGQDSKLAKSFESFIGLAPTAKETWVIEDGKLISITPVLNNTAEFETFPDIKVDYSPLDASERAIVDEFRVAIRYLMLKSSFHMPMERGKVEFLINEVQKHTEGLVYLKSLEGKVPQSLDEYTSSELNEAKLQSMLRHQKIDRILQINSALSYISTQAFSGAIPILERRSLIRRHSLLGTGSAILALNRIARFIEKAFSLLPFEQVIKRDMKIAPMLKGIESFPNYDKSNWYTSSVERFEKGVINKSYSKLSYFSGRLGYRETEYSIAAAIQSITTGASLEWSLMTITHEMLHGHERILFSSIFYNEDKDKAEDLKPIIYNEFAQWYENRSVDQRLIQSIRNIMLGYCCSTLTHGSITKKTPANSDYEVVLPQVQSELWHILADERRNISEIYVHVLDLHYFYGGRTAIYIPLIWCTWLAIPNVISQLRQYILRSILAISSTIADTPVKRFWSSVQRFKEILDSNKNAKLNHPIIHEIYSILDNRACLSSEYFYAFRASLCIVDLCKEVFYSSTVRAAIWDDFRIVLSNDDSDELDSEKKLVYNLPSGFNDEQIDAPLAYLLNKACEILRSEDPVEDIERHTVEQFLALNSTKDVSNGQD